MKNLGILGILIFSMGLIETSHNNKLPECSSYDDPHMSTFDKSDYEFQYPGDHYIMYEDFKDTRVTAGYQRCGGATCNCAVYLKKGRKIIFVDFCDVKSDRSPTSQLYGVHVQKNATGLDSIKKVPPCKVIKANDENNESTWKKIPTFLDVFKCATLEGANYYTTYVLRTVEKDFQDSVKVKFRLATRSMPALIISPSESSFENTGGLCGMWDNNRKNELFVLDVDGVEEYLPNLNNIELARDFWKLASRYNKDVTQKRCPECYTISERSFYCPCDDFDMFDITNYNIPHPVPERTTYCKVPMFECIEKFTNLIIPVDPGSSTVEPITTTPRPITTIGEAYELCLEGFVSHPQLGPVIENGCVDVNQTLSWCAFDVFFAQDLSFIQMHIQNLIDTAVQNILTDIEECLNTNVTTLCPDNCNDKGVCVLNEDCDQTQLLFDDEDEDEDVCLSPFKCECNEGFGGKDCSIDLTNIVDFELNKDCCDLRKEDCDEVDIFGFPFSVRDKIYAKIEMIEEGVNSVQTVESIVTAVTYSESNVFVRIPNIDELTLYKNIKSLPANFVLKESTTRVNIYLSYKNGEFDKKKSFILYDSKCRDCKKQTQTTSLLSNKCEIEGICWNNLETNPSESNLQCRPEIDIFNWTDLLCFGEFAWSQWYNIDKPEGDGDLEVTETLQIGCKNPSHFQVRTYDDKVPHDQSGQTVHLDACFGFMCLNVENDPPCVDYELRKCCRK